MTRTLLRAAFATALAATLTTGAASTAAAPVAASAGSTAADCVEPGTDHAGHDEADAGARVRPGQAGSKADTREVSRAEQRRIDTRTRQIVQDKRESRAAAGSSITAIPVYVHVMAGSNGAGNVTDQQIAQQVAVLNETYGGADVNGAGRDTGIRFTLAGANRFFNNSWHQDKQSAQYRAQTRQGGKNALNIWLVDFAYLGVATFPWDYARQPKIDGIRVQYSSLPGGSATNYNLGETTTHEAGHWLGLYHTFQGGCAAPGDSVGDTPAQASPSSGCPVGRDSCTAPGADPIRNYMDYSFDSCYTTFSEGQDARMDQMWTAYRA